jgi:hypothetical protein
MNAELQKKLLIAQCQSMATLLDDRLKDENPWTSFPFDSLDIPDLAKTKNLMHELLYAPPSRN